MGRFDAAQICLNGHKITSVAHTKPEKRQSHCDICGEKTITNCQNTECNTQIRGYFYGARGEYSYDSEIPNFCHKCGMPHPWTQRKTEAAKEYIDELEELNEEEKQKLKNSINDILKDTPNTEVAVVRIKKFLPKIGKKFAEGLQNIIIEIASEAAKKSLGL